MNSGIPDGYEISTDTSRLDAALVYEWMSQDAYWAVGRSREMQDRAVESSLNFGVYNREGRVRAAGESG
jgi:hypothetical protein